MRADATELPEWPLVAALLDAMAQPDWTLWMAHLPVVARLLKCRPEERAGLVIGLLSARYAPARHGLGEGERAPRRRQSLEAGLAKLSPPSARFTFDTRHLEILAEVVEEAAAARSVWRAEVGDKYWLQAVKRTCRDGVPGPAAAAALRRLAASPALDRHAEDLRTLAARDGAGPGWATAAGPLAAAVDAALRELPSRAALDAYVVALHESPDASAPTRRASKALEDAVAALGREGVHDWAARCAGGRSTQPPELAVGLVWAWGATGSGADAAPLEALAKGTWRATPRVAHAAMHALGDLPEQGGATALGRLHAALDSVRARSLCEAHLRRALGVDDTLPVQALLDRVAEAPTTPAARAREVARHVARLEATLLDGRGWSVADWRAAWAEHPLLSAIARTLVWRVDGRAFAWFGHAEGPDGVRFELPEAGEIALWHPSDAPPGERDAFAARFDALAITQALPQLDRQVPTPEDPAATADRRWAGTPVGRYAVDREARADGWRVDRDFGLSREVAGIDVRLDLEVVFDDDDDEPGRRVGALTFVRRRTSEPLPLGEVPPRLFGEAIWAVQRLFDPRRRTRR